jgi:hypothetical protein
MRRRGQFLVRQACWAAICVASAGIAGPGRADGDGTRPQGVGGVGTRRALIICGLPGDDDHRKLFAGTIEKLRQALTGRCGFVASEILVRSDDATREGIASAVGELRKRLTRDDTLWVIVLGHGHYDGRHSHLNLPGPDVDERELARMFEGLNAREQVFWITTSASGFFLKPFSGAGRVVITATEPDQEVNETIFPLAFTDVLASPPDGIDRDKDGQISVLELYLAVVEDVMKRYVADENLPTEHARLDDNGDGRGSELQEDYLPPELGGRPGPAPDIKAKSDSRSPVKPDADGARASKVRVGASPTARP